MWILAMETTGPIASVALINENGEIKEKQGAMGYNHLTSLIPMTKALLEENKLTVKELAAVGVSVGPGSFTGIRIGVSSGRALSQSLGIPCLRIPTLQSFLYNGKLLPGEEQRLVCPILDARRDQLYGAAFCKGKILVAEGAYSIGEYLARLRTLDGKNYDQAIFYGDGISRYSDTINLWGQAQGIQVIFADDKERYQRASSGAIIAKAQWDSGKHLSYNQLLPEYMRISEAEQRLKDGTLNV